MKKNEKIISLDGPFGFPVVSSSFKRELIIDRNPTMILGIIGSRKRSSKADKLKIKDVILKLRPGSIVTGDAKRGADKYARFYAERFGVKLIVHKAKINNGMKYPEMVKEYYRRNNLVAQSATHIYALVSKDRKGGTENTIKYFKKYNKDWKKKIILD